nr:U1/U2 small nuclear ribonucleoprotein U1A2B-1 [Euglena gracilis]
MQVAPYSYEQANHCIYIRNINEKVKRDELLKQLWAVFQQFGEILDICARPKKQSLRGQAWVVFRDISSAAAALQQMQGYMFHSKPLVVSYSKQKSDAIAKLDGTYVERKKPREKKKRKVAAEEPASKRRRGPQTGKKNEPQPNKVLFVEQLPARDDTQQMLTVLFQNFQGFREVRLPPSNTTVAFVEFDSEMTSAYAMSSLQGFQIMPGHELKVSYAKK